MSATFIKNGKEFNNLIDGKSILGKRKKTMIVKAILCGIIVGFINGFLGGGGGMILVPYLENILRYNKVNSHASAIFLILPISIVSGIMYISFGAMDFLVSTPVFIGVIIGGFLGAKMLINMKSIVIEIIFLCIMTFAGIKLAFF